MDSKKFNSLKCKFENYVNMENFDGFYISVNFKNSSNSKHCIDSIFTRSSKHVLIYLDLFVGYSVEVYVCYKSFLKQSKLIYSYTPVYHDWLF